MPKKILWFVIIMAPFAWGAIHAQPLPQENFAPGFAGYSLTTPVQEASLKKVILLNNGRVVNGEILSNGDPVQVRSELGIISIPRGEIALVATTIQEIYQFQKANTPNTSDGILKLADWCVTNKLANEAALEFDRAIRLTNDPQLADSIRIRKNAALSMFGERQLQTQMVDQESQKYRQWKQQVPPATFATFKREILPMLVQNCSGIACHSSNSLNEFRLLANQHNSDVDVAKNLQIVLGYIASGLPEESPLVLIPIAPHGRTKQIFTRRNFAQYEKLYFWSDQVAGEMDAYYPLDESDRVAANPGNKRRQSDTSYESNNMTIQPASGGMVTFPIPGETLVENPMTDGTSSQNQPSSLSQGLIKNTGIPSFPAQRQADFNFLGQKSIVPPGQSPGGWQNPVSAGNGLQQEPPTNVMTHTSTDAFKQNSVLQQLQRDPIDPFDPVLFNRQYHLRRLQESDNQ